MMIFTPSGKVINLDNATALWTVHSTLFISTTNGATIREEFQSGRDAEAALESIYRTKQSHLDLR